MGAGAMVYVPGFIKISSGIQKLIREKSQTRALARTHAHTHTQTAT
jgi:hypothetical protein